jgi:uncharacterized protein (DUF2336 family)
MSASRSASTQSGFQALIELARRDRVELRPTLVRVLADQFVQEPAHSPLERARFAELICRLLDGVDTPTRAAVAERLASYPGTPTVVAARLARDEISVAEPILRRSPALGEAELHAILDTCGIAHAIAIKMRSQLPAGIVKRLNTKGQRAVQPAPAARSDARPADGPALTIALARRYLATDADERKLILKALPACPAIEHEERIRRIERGFGDQLERAALRHQAQEFAVLLRRVVGMPAELAARVVADPAGDPLLVVSRALEIPFGATSRILLFLNPEIGASVQQVFALAEWFEAMQPAAARRLVGAWCMLATAHAPRDSDTRRRTREPAIARLPARAAGTRANASPARRAGANEP